MGNFWCVDPASNTEVLTLSYAGHEFKITVLRELTVGEQRAIETAGFHRMTMGGRRSQNQDDGAAIAVDWNKQSFARTLTYLKDWTLTDDKGNKLPISRDMIESLKTPVYEVIDAAITKHVEAMEELRKNAQTGDASQLPTSA